MKTEAEELISEYLEVSSVAQPVSSEGYINFEQLPPHMVKVLERIMTVYDTKNLSGDNKTIHVMGNLNVMMDKADMKDLGTMKEFKRMEFKQNGEVKVIFNGVKL